jgi:hypothetical protein
MDSCVVRKVVIGITPPGWRKRTHPGRIVAAETETTRYGSAKNLQAGLAPPDQERNLDGE